MADVAGFELMFGLFYAGFAPSLPWFCDLEFKARLGFRVPFGETARASVLTAPLQSRTTICNLEDSRTKGKLNQKGKSNSHKSNDLTGILVSTSR